MNGFVSLQCELLNFVLCLQVRYLWRSLSREQRRIRGSWSSSDWTWRLKTGSLEPRRRRSESSRLWEYSALPSFRTYLEHTRWIKPQRPALMFRFCFSGKRFFPFSFTIIHIFQTELSITAGWSVLIEDRCSCFNGKLDSVCWAVALQNWPNVLDRHIFILQAEAFWSFAHLSVSFKASSTVWFPSLD